MHQSGSCEASLASTEGCCAIKVIPMERDLAQEWSATMTHTAMRPEWNLHYERWMIADGEPEREVGESFDSFALQLCTNEGLGRTDERVKSAVPIPDFKYRVHAEVVYVSEKACVLDFGLKAITTRDLLPPGSKQGDYVTGEIFINIPLCMRVAPEDILETLKYKWHVNRISANLTPHVAHWSAPRIFVRDKSQIQYQEVSATHTVMTHSYVLHCSEIA